jgi:ribose transport system ATP-binding protein
LRAERLVKRFAGVLALDQAGITLAPGEIHGLIGENGAGKSTLIRILAGIYRQDAGSIWVDGRELTKLTPAVVAAHGIRFVHQEVDLPETLTVAETVFLGQEASAGPFLATRAMARRAQAFIAEYLGADLPGQALIRSLGPAERKLVQIARALIDGQARLLVLDEPTAPLAATETERLFAAVRRLSEHGVACLYVSHYLGEIRQLCHRVTVLREGQVAGVVNDVAGTPVEEMVELMIGQRVDQLFPSLAPPAAGAKPALEVIRLTARRRFKDVSFTVLPGEIVGLAGLLGSGRHPLIDSVMGLRPPDSGEVRAAGRRLRLRGSAAPVRAGLALVPRDRRQSGVVLRLSVSANLALGTLRRLNRFGVIIPGRVKANAARMIERLDIRPAQPRLAAGLLSGGNQQKLVLGRWIAADAPVLILEEPTVGVDVGAKAEIYRLIAELAAGGTAVVLSSNDTQELAGLTHRVLVLRRGEVVAEVATAASSQDELAALTTGAEPVAP